jgi:hypothetical protein
MLSMLDAPERGFVDDLKKMKISEKGLKSDSLGSYKTVPSIAGTASIPHCDVVVVETLRFRLTLVMLWGSR